MTWIDISSIFPILTESLLIRFTLVGISVFHLISSLEAYSIRREFAVGGIFDWRVQSQKYDFSDRIKILNFVYTYDIYYLIIITRLIVSIILLINAATIYNNAITLISVSILMMALILQNVRMYYGRDGADQMAFVLLFGVMVSSVGILAGSSINYGLIIIAAQSYLSYAASGGAKLASPVWRSGEALSLVLNHRSYGNAWLSGIANERNILCMLMCWVIIIFQLGFVTSLFFGEEWFLIYMGMGVMFHAALMIVMGLGQFLSTFPFSYPSNVYLFGLVSEVF